MSEKEILIKAINTYGKIEQENMAIEECSELIQAIRHKHRDRKNNIAEEIADVEIMLEQLKIINDCHEEVEEIHKKKINRLFKKVKNKPNEELKPCPFCGSTDIKFTALSIISEYYVGCNNCGAYIDLDIPWDDMNEKQHDEKCWEALIKAWNRRKKHE